MWTPLLTNSTAEAKNSTEVKLGTYGWATCVELEVSRNLPFYMIIITAAHGDIEQKWYREYWLGLKNAISLDLCFTGRQTRGLLCQVSIALEAPCIELPSAPGREL